MSFYDEKTGAQRGSAEVPGAKEKSKEASAALGSEAEARSGPGGKEGAQGHLKEKRAGFNDSLEKETSKMTPNSNPES